jgi:uncharacterized membrane protein YgaE (UPF0421/DUF939 family)
MIGARVIKTAMAVTLSILTARSLELDTPQFAGVIAVLAVQPSIYRSFRYGVQHTVSAILGAIFGAYALQMLGNSFLIMGMVAFLLMVLHVKLRWTNSLLVSVVIAINTMGTASHFFGQSALNQMALVLIGTGIGALVNLFHKPVHHERAEHLLIKSDGMLRSLLYYMYLDLMENRVTPYVKMREQINEVRRYIEEGKDISILVNEDRRFRNPAAQNTLVMFQSFESMVERIRDISKELQKIDVKNGETASLKKALLVVAGMQERHLAGKKIHSEWLEKVFDNKRNDLWGVHEITSEFKTKLACYNCYGFLKEYLRELTQLKWKEILNPNNSELSSGKKKDFLLKKRLRELQNE